MRKILAVAVALLTVAPSTVLAADQCDTLPTWGDVPANVRQALEKSIGTVADKDQAFNATDVIQSGLASNRFLAACQTGNFVSVAVERGGRGYRIEVSHYLAGKLVRHWSELVGRDHTATVNLMKPSNER